MTTKEMKVMFDVAISGYWYLDLGLHETYNMIFGITVDR